MNRLDAQGRATQIHERRATKNSTSLRHTKEDILPHGSANKKKQQKGNGGYKEETGTPLHGRRKRGSTYFTTSPPKRVVSASYGTFKCLMLEIAFAPDKKEKGCGQDGWVVCTSKPGKAGNTLGKLLICEWHWPAAHNGGHPRWAPVSDP